MQHGPVLLIEVGIGLGVVALCSIPALTGFFAQLRSRSPKKDSYEDLDGKATPEAFAAFSNKWSKALVFLVTAIGCGCSIAVSILSTLHLDLDGLTLENWLGSASWVRNSVPRPAVVE
jgi:hypothetical protein